MDEEKIKDILRDILEEHRAINDEVHAAHHAFIEMMIKKEERRVQRWETIRTQVGGWGIIIAIGFIGKAVWSMAATIITRG